MRREPQFSKITYNMSLPIPTGGYVPTDSIRVRGQSPATDLEGISDEYFVDQGGHSD